MCAAGSGILLNVVSFGFLVQLYSSIQKRKAIGVQSHWGLICDLDVRRASPPGAADEEKEELPGSAGSWDGP